MHAGDGFLRTKRELREDEASLLESVEGRLRRAASLAFVQCDETAAMHVELFLLRYSPLVKTAAAQRFALRARRR
jgi:hypothetical protein